MYRLQQPVSTARPRAPCLPPAQPGGDSPSPPELGLVGMATPSARDPLDTRSCGLLAEGSWGSYPQEAEKGMFYAHHGAEDRLGPRVGGPLAGLQSASSLRNYKCTSGELPQMDHAVQPAPRSRPRARLPAMPHPRPDSSLCPHPASMRVRSTASFPAASTGDRLGNPPPGLRIEVSFPGEGQGGL